MGLMKRFKFGGFGLKGRTPRRPTLQNPEHEPAEAGDASPEHASSSGLKISQKLGLILIVLLLGVACTGIAYKRLLDVESKTDARADQVMQFNQALANVRLGLFAAQRFEKEFFLEKIPHLLKSFDDTMVKVKVDISRLDKLASNEDQRRRAVPVAGFTERYHTAVRAAADAQISIGLHATDAALGALRNAASELDELVKNSGDPAIERWYLLARRHEQGYLRRDGVKYLERMNTASAEFAKAIAASGFSEPAKAGLSEKLSGYQSAFKKVASLTRSRNIRRRAIIDTVKGLEPRFESLLEASAAGMKANQELAKAEIARSNWIFLAALVAVAGIVTLALIILTRGITRSLGRLQQTVDDVAAGELEARVGLTTGDELGTLGRAFDRLLDERVSTVAEAQKENEQLNRSVIDLLQAVYRVTQRDLTVKLPITEDVFGSVADSLNMMVAETVKVLQGVLAVAGSVADTSQRVKVQSDSVVAVAAEEQQQVEQAATELAEASNTMARIAALAKRCDSAADLAIQSTERAQKTVLGTVSGINNARDTIRETEKRIKRLGERSQEITRVVNLINTIAERTHILALNASMHAASAGEAGRGFVVVADEVQRLAESARQATLEISTLVNNIQTETAGAAATMNEAISQVVAGTELAEQGGDQMNETREKTQGLVRMVRQIAKDSIVQAQTTRQLRVQAETIRGSAQQTGDQLRQQSSDTDRLVEYSDTLVEAVSVFTLPRARPVVVTPTRSIAREDTDTATPAKEAVAARG